MKRERIGIDVTHLAVGAMKLRLKDLVRDTAVETKKAEPPALADDNTNVDLKPAFMPPAHAGGSASVGSKRVGSPHVS